MGEKRRIVGQISALTHFTRLILSTTETKCKLQHRLPKQTFYVFLAVSIMIITANIFGYAALSRFVFERFVLLASLLTLALLIRAIIRPYFYKIDALISQNKNNQNESQENLVFFWLSLTLDMILFFITLPIIAGLFGAEWNDIQQWAKEAFFGFKIGNFTVSISGISIGIITFLMLLFITRFVQSVLSNKILPKTKMDLSVRQSITQVLGYIAFCINQRTKEMLVPSKLKSILSS